MITWFVSVLRGAFRDGLDERGNGEAIVIALVVFLLILILAGRRVLVQ